MGFCGSFCLPQIHEGVRYKHSHTHSYRREREESLPQSQKPLKLQQLLGDTTEEVTVSSLLNLGTRNSLEFKLSAPGQEFIAKLP